jgi:hypothetical protein
MQMRSRRLLLLVTFNLFAIAAIVVMLFALLTAEDERSATQASCVSGPDARSSGRPVTLNEAFASVEDAEAFICHRIAYPRENHGWRLENVSATRNAPARVIAAGRGFASVTLDYAPLQSSADLRLEVSPFDIAPVTYGDIQEVRVMGEPARLIRGSDPTLVVLQWEAEGYNFHAIARLTDDFPLQDLYAVLNSIR